MDLQSPGTDLRAILKIAAPLRVMPKILSRSPMPPERLLRRALSGKAELSRQDEKAKSRDPAEIHHAADEKQLHQHPAATQAESAMPRPHPGTHLPFRAANTKKSRVDRQCRRRIVSTASIDRDRRRSAPHPSLLYCRLHCWRQQSRLLDTKLERPCCRTEYHPNCHVPQGEGTGPCGTSASFAAAPCDGGEEPDHRRGARQHHCHHQYGPHHEDESAVGECPRARSHRYQHIAHLLHHPGTGQQITPGQRHNEQQAENDEQPVAVTVGSMSRRSIGPLEQCWLNVGAGATLPSLLASARHGRAAVAGFGVNLQQQINSNGRESSWRRSWALCIPKVRMWPRPPLFRELRQVDAGTDSLRVNALNWASDSTGRWLPALWSARTRS